jgi:hypothetical protein
MTEVVAVCPQARSQSRQGPHIFVSADSDSLARRDRGLLASGMKLIQDSQSLQEELKEQQPSHWLNVHLINEGCNELCVRSVLLSKHTKVVVLVASLKSINHRR